MQRLLTRFLVAIAIATSASMISVAQEVEIEIVNANGDRVGAQNIPANQPGNSQEPAPEESGQPLERGGNLSITVQKSTRSIDENGKRQTQSYSKAYIIGPDGKRREIELAPGSGDTQLALDMFRGIDGTLGRATAVQAGKYFVGVHCEPVPAALAAQLELESGLLVNHVSPESPAAKAGVLQHDILMFADDKQLSVTGDLIAAVQVSGEKKLPVALTVVRRGKTSSINVAPAERPAGQTLLDAFPANGLDFRFQEFGPGAILNDDFDSSLKQQMQEIQQRMQQMEQRLQQRQQQFAPNKPTP